MNKGEGFPTSNVFDDIPAELPQELFTDILNGKSFRMERIVSHGHTTEPDQWYDQEQHEWVMLMSGGATLRFENNQCITLKPGDYINIPAHCRHRVERTDEATQTLWLAIHYE